MACLARVTHVCPRTYQVTGIAWRPAPAQAVSVAVGFGVLRSWGWTCGDGRGVAVFRSEMGQR